MLTREENELLTRTVPGPQTGRLFRRYWTPFLLASELSVPDCRPALLRLMSEYLIASARPTAAWA